ncbi:MFS transporter [Nakamurella sp. YIM 132087]|uniref:MFS transporter n=1 Tax=Nakamurella alba TaxID=2665158 RepID=A0A7K1FTF3_9ACTN|nr:oligopeptide:H+ symporter [Nakamurella alba]MTD17435.1 MFS transporter [Nakamurella alba]
MSTPPPTIPPTLPSVGTAPDPSSGSTRTFFGQPWSLANIFGVEMWERFSFYGMQGILLIYLWFPVAQGGLAIDQGVAAGIVGAYGGTVYLSTVLGAWLADRVFGSERVLFGSAILIMIGHVALAVLPGVIGVGVGLCAVAIGSGGLKANTTTIVGSLYSEHDPRRDAGFSLFYLGINLGALVGPLLTGLLQSELGFHYGFGLAALGMALGLVQYSFGRRILPDITRHPSNPLPASRRPLMAGIALAGVVVIVLVVLIGWVTADNLDDVVALVTLAAALGYFAVILRDPALSAIERKRVFAFVPLFLASTAFWSLYQQQFTVLTIYSADKLDRNLFGWEMPISWVQSINPVFVILLSGVFAAIWLRLGDRQPTTPIKFALGTAVMGVAFLLFLPFASGGAGSTPLLAMCGILFVFTIAELLLSPVGLSLATKLAPRKFPAQMVALFYLSIALGSALSGVFAEFFDVNNEAPYFGILGAVAVGIGVLLAVSARPISRLMSGVR